MNLPSPLLAVSFVKKLVAANCGAVTEWLIEHCGVVWGPVATFLLGLLDLFLDKWRQVVVWVVMALVPVAVIVLGMEVTGHVGSETNESRNSHIAIMGDVVPGRFGEADIQHADDTGHFVAWKGCGRHRFLLMKPVGNELYYSIAVRDKSLAPLDISFEPPFRKLPLKKVTISQFSFDSHVVPTEGEVLFLKWRVTITNPEQYYLLIGHTDRLGDKGHNMDLGLLRAKAIAYILESSGVAKDHIITASVGSEMPVDRSGQESGNSQNLDPLDRRVEILCIPNPYILPNSN